MIFCFLIFEFKLTENKAEESADSTYWPGLFQ